MYIALMVIGFGVMAFALFAIPKPDKAVVAAEQERKRAALSCPHCDTAGHIIASQVVRKQGISGGKATGALLTGGASMLATGLSRKEHVTRMRCTNCGTAWDVA